MLQCVNIFQNCSTLNVKVENSSSSDEELVVDDTISREVADPKVIIFPVLTMIYSFQLKFIEAQDSCSFFLC